MIKSNVTPEARDPDTELERLSSGSDRQLVEGVAYSSKMWSGDAGPSLGRLKVPGDWAPEGSEYSWLMASENSTLKSKFVSVVWKSWVYDCSGTSVKFDADKGTP